MQKIIIDNITNKVLHIINLDIDSSFNEEWYPNCYIIDDIDNEINSYNFIYNKEIEEFEVIEDYQEEVSDVLPSDIEILKKEIKKKDDEILDLKLATAEIVETVESENLELKIAMAEMSEEKDTEIIKLKLALAELVEGGI
ncbi:MAG: hypothetical protein KH415_13330 [Clostridium sp.]|nr:hypothetical protein [Clostridium sp.]